MNKKEDGKKKSFVLSAQALRDLEKITRCTGITQTAAVEIALFTLAQNTSAADKTKGELY